MNAARTAVLSVLAIGACAAAATLPAPWPAPPVHPVAATTTTATVDAHPDHEFHAFVPELAEPVAQPPVRRVVAPKVRPMFRTPEGAMRYLARAYNSGDLARLKHVTTPDARHELEHLRAEATDLRLVRCVAGYGDYQCKFTHAFPASMHRSGRGVAWFTVAPAARPGWYMTVVEGCG